MSEIHTIEWSHPVHGRITEHACRSHEGEVLTALRTLGIGCGGTTAPEGSTCHRCAYPGLRPRMWLPELAQ